MEQENLNVKRSLILQSFAPLFFLILIKNIDIVLFVRLFIRFFIVVGQEGIKVVGIVWNHEQFGPFVISILSIIWLLATVIIALGFRGYHSSGFRSVGETITVAESPNDGGATFLVTYVLPLLTNNVESARDLLVFLTMLIMVIMLLTRSNMFYQNPILYAMKYRTFTFVFDNPSSDILDKEKTYVGITKGAPIVHEAVIKRKYIADGVFFIYND
ncbi:MAG: hypothetical protein UHG91_00950 [Succinivibrionaceae bacterium]|nr:hypothetical protein [Succinivibrionaceae bacterium]